MWLFDLLFPPRVDETLLRAVSDDTFFTFLSPRLVDKTRPGTVALLPFATPAVRGALHEAKYHGNERAFTLLGTVLADYLRDADDVSHKAIIVPVPLGKHRTKERGFNQVEETVRRATRELPLSIQVDLLIRTRETLSQVSLPRGRREENMRGAFSATRPANPTYTYVVIDDVITTGATLQAAIDALRDAGALHIIPLALAH